MFARIENNTPVEWPILNIQQRFPGTSFPSPITQDSLPDGYVVVSNSPQPQAAAGQKVVPAAPVQSGDAWVQGWALVDMTEAEVAEQHEALRASVVNQTQQRLDDFARTRNYDGILSACTYATSTVLKFQAEGQYCVEARDATWSALYEMLDEINAGTRPVPSGFAEIEAELPPLEWPLS